MSTSHEPSVIRKNPATDRAQHLAEFESKVRHRMSLQIGLGRELFQIKAGKLYRPEFKKFGRYLQEKWGLSRSTANRWIAAGEVIHVMLHRIGEKGPDDDLYEKLECHSDEPSLRALRKHAPSTRWLETFRLAATIAGSRPLRKHHVLAAAKRLQLLST